VTESQFHPGDVVRLPQRPDWGLGRVQSSDGRRVVVNFEDAGKQVVDTAAATLQFVSEDPREA
jgi:hypothetical protein